MTYEWLQKWEEVWAHRLRAHDLTPHECRCLFEALRADVMAAYFMGVGQVIKEMKQTGVGGGNGGK